MILLDTHVLLWMDADDPALGTKARQSLQGAWADGQVAVSAITFWECAMLHALGRIVMPRSPEVWRADLIAAGLREVPLSGEAAMLSVTLELPHKDPAAPVHCRVGVDSRRDADDGGPNLLRWRHELRRQDATK